MNVLRGWYGGAGSYSTNASTADVELPLDGRDECTSVGMDPDDSARQQGCSRGMDDDTQLVLRGGPTDVVTSSLLPSRATSSLRAAEMLIQSRLDDPTLLPSSVAQLVSAATLAARVSLRASAFFLEAILEASQCSTETSMGITRRALIAAIQSARLLQSGRTTTIDGHQEVKPDDAYLRVLDKYTNVGVYLIHNAFSLAELFAMSGFYLTKTIVSGGFTAAEESVKLFDDLFGNTEPSRALASIISLVRRELTQDAHFTPSQHGKIAALSALTKALTAFACLQNATHRRSLESFKLRVVYDCTVISREDDDMGSQANAMVDQPGHGRSPLDARCTEPLPDDHNGPVADVGNTRDSGDIGRSWKDDFKAGELEYCRRDLSRDQALEAQEPELGSDEEIVDELDQLVGGHDEMDAQSLRRASIAEIPTEVCRSPTVSRDDELLEYEASEETTRVSMTIEHQSSHADPLAEYRSNWVDLPATELGSPTAMHDCGSLGTAVRTLTTKVVTRKRTIRRVIRPPYSLDTPAKDAVDAPSTGSGVSSMNSLSRPFLPMRRTDSNESTTSAFTDAISDVAQSPGYTSAKGTPLASPPPTPSHIHSPLMTRAVSFGSTSSQRTRTQSVISTAEACMPSAEENTSFPGRHLVENLQAFCKYSSAAYGQHFLRILRMGSVDYNFPSTTSHHANVHAFAHHCGLKVKDILLSSFTSSRSSPLNNSKAPPIVHYIAVDHNVRAIVLTLRGTLGLGDLLVDLTADYEDISVEGAVPSGSYYAHRGMLASARQLKAERGVVHDTLKHALQDHPDYGLIVTGHSLGGGVAALVSMLWASPIDNDSGSQQDPPETPADRQFVTNRSSGLPPGRPMHCYAYGIPCVASPDLATWAKGLVTSVVHHLDVVATLSLGTLRDFKQVAAALWEDDGRVAEEVVGRVVGLYQQRYRKGRPTLASSEKSRGREALMDVELDNSRFSIQDVLHGRKDHLAEAGYEDPALLGRHGSDDADLDDWLWSLMKTLRATADTDKLYPPGHVYVIESHPVYVQEQTTANDAKYVRKEGRRVILRYSEDVSVRFSEPVFSRSMFLDHSPSAYEGSLDTLAQAVLP